MTSEADTGSTAAVRVGLTHDQIATLLAPNTTRQHVVARCDQCGAPAMVNAPDARNDGRPCRLTPKCDGKHRTTKGLPQ